MSGSRGRGELGETLVEVLVAISILGLAGVAVMAGLGLAVKSSDIHRKDTTGGAYVKGYAEAIQNWVAAGHWQGCASATYPPDTVGYVPPPAGSFESPTIDWVKSVPARGPIPSGDTSVCNANYPDIEALQLSVASSDGRADEKLVVVIRRSCGPTQNVCS